MNPEKKIGPVVENGIIPHEWAKIWQKGNLIYPQTMTGISITFGPTMISELLAKKTTLDQFHSLRFEDDQKEKLLKQAKKVHVAIGIPANIEHYNLDIIWSHSLAEITKGLLVQIGACFTPSKDPKLASLYADNYRIFDTINHFLDGERYQEHHDWIQSMWDETSKVMLSRDSKAMGKLIFQKVIDNYHNRHAGISGDYRNHEYWEVLRDKLYAHLKSTVTTPFSTPREKELIKKYIRSVVTDTIVQQSIRE